MFGILLQLMTTLIVKEEPMLDIDDSKGTSNIVEKDDSKDNSKGMEDDMFGDFATTNDDVTTVKEEPMLDIDDSKRTTVVEKDDSNISLLAIAMYRLIMIPKKIVKVWRTICLEILLQLMTTLKEEPMLIDDSRDYGELKTMIPKKIVKVWRRYVWRFCYDDDFGKGGTNVGYRR